MEALDGYHLETNPGIDGPLYDIPESQTLQAVSSSMVPDDESDCCSSPAPLPQDQDPHNCPSLAVLNLGCGSVPSPMSSPPPSSPPSAASSPAPTDDNPPPVPPLESEHSSPQSSCTMRSESDEAPTPRSPDVGQSTTETAIRSPSTGTARATISRGSPQHGSEDVMPTIESRLSKQSFRETMATPPPREKRSMSESDDTAELPEADVRRTGSAVSQWKCDNPNCKDRKPFATRYLLKYVRSLVSMHRKFY